MGEAWFDLLFFLQRCKIICNVSNNVPKDKGLVFENSKQGFEKLLTEAEAVKAKNKLSSVIFGLEPTANYHKPLGQYLINHAQELVRVSGTTTGTNGELLDGRRDKGGARGSNLYLDISFMVVE